MLTQASDRAGSSSRDPAKVQEAGRQAREAEVANGRRREPESVQGPLRETLQRLRVGVRLVSDANSPNHKKLLRVDDSSYISLRTIPREFRIAHLYNSTSPIHGHPQESL